MRSICYLLLASAVSLLKVEASLAQELSAEDRACINRAGEKLTSNHAIKIERNRVLQQSRERHLYKVMVEIDVSLLGQSSTYVFNCIRNGQLTVVQPMGIR